MGKNDDIFSIAGKSSSKPKAQHTTVTKPAAIEKSIPSSKRNINLNDPKIEAALRKVQEMHDQLEAKIEMVYRRMGLNKETLRRTLDNPQTYEKQLQLTFERGQEQRRLLREQINKMFGPGALEALENKQKKKELDRRSKKSLGARKNWLNMR